MKNYTDEQQIWIDFEAMVSAETEDAARAIAEEMPIKVLRKIWEYKAPAYLTSNTKGLGLSSFRKKDWVDEVVILAMSIRAERLAEQAKSRAVNEGLPVSSDGTVMFKVGAVYIKKCEYRRVSCVTPLIGYEHWTIVGLTSCYAYVRNLDGHMSSHTIKRRREGDNVERIYIGSMNGGWLEATDIAVEGALVPIESETQEEEYRDADGDNSHSGEDIPVCVEVEAPANDVETAVNAAQTAVAIEAVLKKCTKAEMLRVLSESTNGTRTAKVSTKKCDLVSQIARQIVEYRAERKFRELTLDEKYEYLTSQTDKHEVTQVFWCMSGTEFEEIARRLGIDAKGSYAVTNVQSKLLEMTESNKAKLLVYVEANANAEEGRTASESGAELKLEGLVKALRAASIASEMREVLIQCKRSEMVSALSLVTNGAKHTEVSRGKEETAYSVISELKKWREEESYRAMPYEEKYALLFESDNQKVRMYLSVMSPIELGETALRVRELIPIDVREYLPFTGVSLKTEIESMIKALTEVKAIEEVCFGSTAAELMYDLNRVSEMALAIMVKKSGLEVEVRRSYFNMEAKTAISRHYATEEAKCVYEPERVEGEYSDAGGDNAHPEDDIPSEGLDAVSAAVGVIETSDAQIERHDALSKCTGVKGKLKASYDSEDAIAWKVLWEIASSRWVPSKEVRLNEAV